MNKLQEDEDYISLKRFNYSVKEVLERYPDGVPDHLIAQALEVQESDLPDLVEDVVLHLRELMKVDPKT